MPYFKESVTFTAPNKDVHRSNASTQYDPKAFTNNEGLAQVGYITFIFWWETWLEKGLQAVGMQRTTGFASGDLLGFHYSQSTIRASDQTRSSSSSYIYQAKAGSTGKRLKVYTQTMVKKIVFDGKKATGVKASLGGALPTYNIKAHTEVILSAGAFQPPQLLIVSGAGPHATLEQFKTPVVSALEDVGQDMWDHVLFGPNFEVAFPTLDKTLHDPLALTQALLQYTTKDEGPLSSNVVEFRRWEKLPDKYCQNFTQATREALSWFVNDCPEVEHISGNGCIGYFAFPVILQPLDGKQYATKLGALVAPFFQGNVTFKSADSLVPPSINLNWLTHPGDQEVAIAWYRYMREIWDTPELRSIRVGSKEAFPRLDKNTDEEILEVMRSSLMTVRHASSPCKMGNQDRDAKGEQILGITAKAERPLSRVKFTYHSISEDGSDGEFYASCEVQYGNAKSLLADWSRFDFLFHSRIDHLAQGADAGKYRKTSREQAYKSFTPFVQYGRKHQGMKEVILDSKTFEASSLYEFQDNNNDGDFDANPYWINNIAHLSGFVLNGSDAVDSQKQVYTLMPESCYRWCARWRTAGLIATMSGCIQDRAKQWLVVSMYCTKMIWLVWSQVPIPRPSRNLYLTNFFLPSMELPTIPS
jgi:choline dehydrogenase-like flavoprotein